MQISREAPAPGQTALEGIEYLCSLENDQRFLRSTRFLAFVFFHEWTPNGPLIHTLKRFRILVRILGVIRI